MSNQLPAASYPGSIWNGLHARRVSQVEKRSPDQYDYDRVAAEIIAVQTKLDSVNGELNSVASDLDTAEGDISSLQGQAHSHTNDFDDFVVGGLLSDKLVTEEDLRFPVSMISVSSTRPPVQTEYQSGLVLAFEYKSLEAQEEQVFFNAQMPHGMAHDVESAIIVPHFHWIVQSPVVGKTATFELEISKAKIGELFSGASYYKQSVTITLAAADGDKHMVTSFPEIFSYSAIEKSTMFLCKFTRLSSTETNPFSGSILVAEIDFHYWNKYLGSVGVQPPT